jgi:ion channel-forming bestrophin family protein
LKVRCAATLTAENYLSDKDVDVILREEGPGSMRPNPLVPAERYTAKDWFKSLLTIPSAVEFKRTLGFLFANAICATMIWVASIMMPGPILQITTIGLMPHLVVGGVLGLLLVLRTSAAYDRFWEARTMWSFLYSRTRELARLAHTSLKGLDREHLLQLIAALPPVLLQHLQSGWKGWGEEGNIELRRQKDRELVDLLSKEDLAVLLPSNNRPYLLVKMMGNIISKAFSDSAAVKAQRVGKREADTLDAAVVQSSLRTEREQAEKLLSGITETIGDCERIVQTPFPGSYSRHTSRLLSVWCITLPLVLVESLQWRVIPFAVLVSWALRAIFEVGNVIKDPFNMAWSGKDDLKLNTSFNGIRVDVMERLPAKERKLLERGGNKLVRQDYDQAKFHTDYKSRPSIIRMFGGIPPAARSRRALVAAGAASSTATLPTSDLTTATTDLAAATAAAAAGGGSGSAWEDGKFYSDAAGGGGGDDDEKAGPLATATGAVTGALAENWDKYLAWQGTISIVERQALTILGSLSLLSLSSSATIALAEFIKSFH